MADSIEIVVNAIDNFSSVLGNFGSIMTGLESTIHLVADAFKGAYDFSAQFIEAASGSEQAVTKLETVLKSTNGSFGLTSQQLQDMALNMQNLSGFSDEAEMSAEAMLMRFENLNDIFPQALQLTNDLARSLGIDLTSAAQTIGKALDDPASGIGRLNTQFKLFNETEMETIKTMAENGDVAGAQALIMERLTEKVGGAAQAFGETFAGQVAIAKEKIDNIKESIGGALLPVLTDLLSKFNEFVDRPEVIQFFKDLASAISDLASGDVSGIDTFFGNLFQHMADAVNNWVTGGGAEALSNNLISWIDSLGTGTTFDSKAATAALNLVSAIGRAFSAFDWSAVLTAMDDSLAAAVEKYDWKSSGDRFGNSIADFFSTGFTTGVDAGLSSSSQNLIQKIGQAISDWFLAAMGVVDWGAAQDTMSGILRQFIVDPVSNAFKNAFTNALAGSIPGMIVAAIQSVIQQIQSGTYVENLGQAIHDFILGAATIEGNQLSGFYTWGENIVSGIIKGIQDYAGNLWSSTHLMLDLWMLQIKAFLGIASPSTLFAGIGEDIVRGLINGIVGMVDWATDKIKSWLADILAPFKAVLDWLGIDTSGIFGTTGGTTGSHDTGTTTTGGGTTSSVTGASTVIFNFYGTTYINGVPTDGQYDCPPNIVIGGTSSQLVPNAL